MTLADHRGRRGCRLPGRPSQRVWVLCSVLALAASGVGYLVVHGGAVAPQLARSWWLLAPAFAFTMAFVLQFEFRQQSRFMSLDQIPLLIGLFFASPVHLVEVRLTATLAVMLLLRRPLIKLTYNVAACGLATTVAVAVFRAAVPLGVGVGPRTWLAALAGALADETVSYWTVVAVVGASEDRWNPAEWLVPLPLQYGLTAVTSCLGLVGVAAIAYRPLTAWALAACVALAIVAFRAHHHLSTKHARLDRLYAFARELGPVAPEPEELGPALAEVRELLHADRLELTLVQSEAPDLITVMDHGRGVEVVGRAASDLAPRARDVLTSGRATVLESARGRALSARRRNCPEDDFMAAPIGSGDRPVGILVAEHRTGPVRGFQRGDLRLLEAVAGQLGTALEKGRLIENLRRAATRDSLTGLPNLESLRAHLVSVLESGRSAGLVLLLLDLDRFRDVNENLGHDAGDQLLVEMGRRLDAATPQQGLCARVGADKFALVLPGSASGEVARLAALAVKSRIEGPVRFGALSADIRLTVGIATAPQHGADGVTLLRRAEMAMVHAKGTTAAIGEWEPRHEHDGARRMQVLAELRQALSDGALEVLYQPKLRLGSGEVVGLEALARWRHQDLGPVSPLEFVPLAEASGLIGALTSNVLRSSLEACRAWHAAGSPVGVSVNLSPRSLTDNVIVGQVAALLTATGVEPRWLTLEITESSFMENPTKSIEILRQLRSLGVRLAIDDFGTGWASLSYVKGLPVHEVKVDREFVVHVADNPADQAVVRAVVELGHSLGLVTVAEGVEEPDQALTLEEMGLDEVQGYFYARPMSAAAAGEWLRPRRAAELAD